MDPEADGKLFFMGPQFIRLNFFFCLVFSFLHHLLDSIQATKHNFMSCIVCKCPVGLLFFP